MVVTRDNIIDAYLQLTEGCPVNTLGPPFSYYYADEIKSNLLVEDLIDFDMEKAVPTICKIYFGEDHPFVQNIFAIEDKMQRNIYVSTTLTEQTKIDGKPYLNEFNLWCKLIILGYVYSMYESISIIEYKKDGLLVKIGREKLEYSDVEAGFLNFLGINGVTFHKRLVTIYLRVGKTSIYKMEDDVEIKGEFKDMPEFLKNSVITRFINGEIYNTPLLYKIKQIYSPRFYRILFRSASRDEIKRYYEFDKSRYLDINGNLSNMSSIYPKAYLTHVVYPILSLLRQGVNEH